MNGRQLTMIAVLNHAIGRTSRLFVDIKKYYRSLGNYLLLTSNLTYSPKRTIITKMKLQISTCVFASLGLLSAPARAAQCISPMFGTSVDISYACCSDSEALFDINGGALYDTIQTCADEAANDMVTNIFSYCNSDFTRCTIDFDNYKCIDDFMDMCEDYGGIILSGNLELQCSLMGQPMTWQTRNRETCAGASCTDYDLEVLFDEMAEYLTLQTGMMMDDCKVTSKEAGVKTNGMKNPILSRSSGVATTAPLAALHVVAFVLSFLHM